MGALLEAYVKGGLGFAAFGDCPESGSSQRQRQAPRQRPFESLCRDTQVNPAAPHPTEAGTSPLQIPQ